MTEEEQLAADAEFVKLTNDELAKSRADKAEKLRDWKLLADPASMRAGLWSVALITGVTQKKLNDTFGRPWVWGSIVKVMRGGPKFSLANWGLEDVEGLHWNVGFEGRRDNWPEMHQNVTLEVFGNSSNITSLCNLLARVAGCPVSATFTDPADVAKFGGPLTFSGE